MSRNPFWCTLHQLFFSLTIVDISYLCPQTLCQILANTWVTCVGCRVYPFIYRVTVTVHFMFFFVHPGDPNTTDINLQLWHGLKILFVEPIKFDKLQIVTK